MDKTVICPDFDDADADIVLRTIEVTTKRDGCLRVHHPQLFKVRREFLSATSPVFRDMFKACQDQSRSATNQAYVQMQDGTFELRHMLLAHSDDIQKHPDFTDVSWGEIMLLLGTAVKYSTPGWQRTLETEAQCSVPLRGLRPVLKRHFSDTDLRNGVLGI